VQQLLESGVVVPYFFVVASKVLSSSALTTDSISYVAKPRLNTTGVSKITSFLFYRKQQLLAMIFIL